MKGIKEVKNKMTQTNLFLEDKQEDKIKKFKEKWKKSKHDTIKKMIDGFVG